MNKLCARCGKPVYFAERKTSLGREWHPSCLKCTECGKVLSPGQHAEHKSLPYCHHPCYRALFGPSILGYGSNISSPANFTKRDRPVSEFSQQNASSYSKEIYSQSQNRPKSASESTPTKPLTVYEPPTALQILKQKIEAFNKYYKGKIHHQMSAEVGKNGNVEVIGPLRIYWGLSRPIQLVHCDDIEPAPVSQWRYSLFAGHKTNDLPEHKLSGSVSFRRPSSPTKVREADDLLSPPSSDDVVRRKKGVRKFKTVAYRGDQPTKWKRASINGHVFNYDTSVFTPVLGSCTSVTVDENMTSLDVIETLLDKFKVQNAPDQYVLSIVGEEGERLLTDADKPLLERLSIGPDENDGKFFIKEREIPPETVPVNSHIQMPIVETAEEENLPYEVEQLLVLPEAVLRGILVKFSKDEEKDVSLIKARYESAKKRILSRMGEMSNQTVSVV